VISRTPLVRSLTASLLALVALSGVATGGAVPLARAASITVSTFADELDINGHCSLREAILAANRDAPVDSCRAGRRADTIRLAAGRYELTLEGIWDDAGETGDLDVSGPLSIIGAGRDETVIAGDATDRVLDVHGTTLSLTNLSVLGQSDLINPDPELPAGWYTHGRGGGIRNQGGDLRLTSTSVVGRSYADPHACRWCWDGEGGAIANEGGTLTISKSKVSGKAAWGGAVASILGTVVITDSEFTGEAIEYGGTFLLYGAQAQMTRVTITGSRSQGQALITGGPGGTLTMRDSEMRDNWGGISNVGGHVELFDTVIAENVGTLTGPLGDQGPGAMSNSGTAELTRVSVLDNDGGFGGAIANSGKLTIQESTIAGNSGVPGAIDSSYEGSSLTLVNTTVSGNSAKGDEAPSALSMWDGLLRSTTIVDNVGAWEAVWVRSGEFANTIIADNVSTYGGSSVDCGSGIYETPGAFSSLGYNLIENGDNCVAQGDSSTDIRGVDPLLGPLANNGGTTLSHLPLPGSVLIDAGNPAKPSNALAACPPRDQLGTRRPQDGDGDRKARCDIGAVERVATRR
jgi:CSLREA domain-containing protein